MSLSAEFPFEWENPEDAKLFWTRDTVHEPKPSLPFRHSFSRDLIGAGIGRVHQVFPFPGSSRSIRVNGYTFSTDMPDPPDVAASKIQQLTAIIPQHIADLPRRWREEFQPELERDLGRWRETNLPGLTWDELVSHLEQVFETTKRHWEIHFLVVYPVISASKPLSEMYARLTGDTDEQTPYRLLAGFPSKTTERDLALWELSEMARRAPAVMDTFLVLPPDEVLSELRELPASEGGAFLTQLEQYLATYGDRGEGSLEEPTWKEDPTFVLLAVKAYLTGRPRHPQDELKAIADERERLEAETLAAIRQAHGDAECGAFQRVLAAAQAVYPLRETHAFYIDQAGMSQVRYVVVEVGKRLAAMGALAQPQDVFYLEIPELLDVIHHPRDVSPLVAQRRADYERWDKLVAPASIGAPQTTLGGDSEVAKFFRPIDTTLPAGIIKELKGAGGSKGIARGPARVVRETHEFWRVQPGDILVAPTTMPPWTPLFRVIAGLVTDSGGVLSHGAIVAREYGLPAVVGTGYATRALKDGQMVEVDGARGVVTLINIETSRRESA
ncbi:MAG: hypothetical protein HYR71_08825 [Chloroflexi bacterium]|nr:hypothetical protein [Chloroflexota bacterium]